MKSIASVGRSRRNLFRAGLRRFPDHQAPGSNHQRPRYPDPLKVSTKPYGNPPQSHCRRPHDSNEWSDGLVDGAATMDRLNQLWVGLLRCTLTGFNFGCFLATDGAFSFLYTQPSPVGFTTNLES